VRARAKFCWQVLSRGVDGLNSTAGWVGLVALLLGVAAGITVPLVVHTSAWVTAAIVMGALGQSRRGSGRRRQGSIPGQRPYLLERSRRDSDR
jgi:hypothetical protein